MATNTATVIPSALPSDTQATVRTASWIVLRSGAWGIRVVGSTPAEGDILAATNKAGKTTHVVVDRVVWTGENVALCAIVQSSRDRTARKPRASRTAQADRASSPRRTTCRECHGPLTDVPEHRAMHGLCGQCAFDEYDC